MTLTPEEERVIHLFRKAMLSDAASLEFHFKNQTCARVKVITFVALKQARPMT